MQIDDNILKRIDALMARAKETSGASLEERRTSAVIAIETMAKYGLTLESLRAERNKLSELENQLQELTMLIDEGLYTTPQELGRRGGLIGGKARAEKLTRKRRLEISRDANAAKAAKKLARERLAKKGSRL